jgi:hypothetical protein
MGGKTKTGGTVDRRGQDGPRAAPLLTYHSRYSRFISPGITVRLLCEGQAGTSDQVGSLRPAFLVIVSGSFECPKSPHVLYIAVGTAG